MFSISHASIFSIITPEGFGHFKNETVQTIRNNFEVAPGERTRQFWGESDDDELLDDQDSFKAKYYYVTF